MKESYMIKHLKFLVFILATAILMALLEIQIEGDGGWARNLPTWRLVLSGNFLGMFGDANKPLTGYHFYLWLLLLVLPHSAFLLVRWTPQREFSILACYVFFTTAEGLLWFVFNPAYGWQKFNPQVVSWYDEPWILGLPLEYYWRFGMGFLFYWLGITRRELFFLKWGVPAQTAEQQSD
jgi:hypothetical protein